MCAAWTRIRGELRVTFPVSLSSLSIRGVSDVGGFVEKLGIAAIIPGVEVEIPLGTRTLVRPFGELGIGKSRDSSAEEFYGAGLRAHTTADQKTVHVTYGGMISGRKTPELAGTTARYAGFEGGPTCRFLWVSPCAAGRRAEAST